MAMQSPEMLLKELNTALRRLRGACTDLGNEEIDDKLLEVMRRLLLAEVLGNTWIVAVGGSQGAGKTTLMASIYDLRGEGPRWLQSNEGRGEKMPVLILEQDELKEPQGFVRRLTLDEASRNFRLEDALVDVAEFQRVICDPNPEDLLPVLRVPRRYFKRENQAWLLLPGYEKQERSNRAWQELMRQAMIAAGGCIVVTDETRMANQQQLEIVKDMLDNELKACRPYIVISKTEAHRNDPVRQAALRASARETFQVPIDLADKNIILSGTDDASYVMEWMPLLRNAIEDLNYAGQSDRHLQASHLSAIVGKDLTRVVNLIRSKSRLYLSSDDNGGDGAQTLADVLENFDLAAHELRTQHSELVSQLAAAAFNVAAGKMNSRLIAEHEGLSNWISNALDTTSETKKKMQGLVQEAWRHAAPTFFNNYSSGLEKLTMGALGRLPEIKNAGQTPLKIQQSSPLLKMGYIHASGKPVQFSRLNPASVTDIQILLGNSSQEQELEHQASSKQLGMSVDLIPALSLEYSRIYYAMPELSGLKHGFAQPDESGSSNPVASGIERLQAGVDLGKTAIRSLATVLAVDVVSDGDSDLLGALFGKNKTDDAEPAAPESTDGSEPARSPTLPTVPMTLHPAAVAATAAVAAAYLATTAVTRIRTFEKAASAQAHNMLGSVHDHHIDHLRKQFDKTMNVARARIKEKIRARYRMDEMLMRKDRLTKALADVTSVTSDLRYELDSSAVGMQLFVADRVL